MAFEKITAAFAFDFIEETHKRRGKPVSLWNMSETVNTKTELHVLKQKNI